MCACCLCNSTTSLRCVGKRSASASCMSRCAVMYLYQIYQNNMAPTVLGLFPMFVGAVSVEGTHLCFGCIIPAVHALCLLWVAGYCMLLSCSSNAPFQCVSALIQCVTDSELSCAGPELPACPPKLRQVYADFRLAQVCTPLLMQTTFSRQMLAQQCASSAMSM